MTPQHVVKELMLVQAMLEEESHEARFAKGDRQLSRDLEMKAKGIKVAIDTIVSKFGIE